VSMVDGVAIDQALRVITTYVKDLQAQEEARMAMLKDYGGVLFKFRFNMITIQSPKLIGAPLAKFEAIDVIREFANCSPLEEVRFWVNGRKRSRSYKIRAGDTIEMKPLRSKKKPVPRRSRSNR